MSLLRSPLWKRLQVSLQLACPRLFFRITSEQMVAMLHFLKMQKYSCRERFSWLPCGLSRDESMLSKKVFGIDWSLNGTIFEETFFIYFLAVRARYYALVVLVLSLLACFHHVPRANQTSSKLENRSEILQGKELSSGSYSKVFACFSTESASLASFTRFWNVFKDAQYVSGIYYWKWSVRQAQVRCLVPLAISTKRLLNVGARSTALSLGE